MAASLREERGVASLRANMTNPHRIISPRRCAQLTGGTKMGWSLPSLLVSKNMSLGRGSSGLSSFLSTLCVCVCVGMEKWEPMNGEKPQTCQVILSTPVHSCARDWLAGCQTHFLFLTDTYLDYIFPPFL